MRFSESNIRFLQTRLQVFLGALLRVKADRIIIRMVGGAQLPFRSRKITFCFIHPLMRDRLHKALALSR